MKPKSKLVVLLILVSFISTAFFVPQVSASGEAWLTGWDYRKELTMDEVAGAVADYPLDLTVFYGSGADTTEEVYLDSKCQIDFDDIRFTDDDGDTELDYWMETYIASTNATFWIEIADIIAGEVTLFIYYGNAGSTTSNGTGVFLFFDNFEDGTLNAWDTAEANWKTVSAVSEPYFPKNGDYTAYGDADATGRVLNQGYSPSLTSDFMIHQWVRFEAQDSSAFPMYGWEDGTDDVYFLAQKLDDFETYDGVGWVGYEADVAIDDTWIRTEIAVDYTNSLFRLWVDRTSATDTRPNKDGVGDIITGVTDIGSITSTADGKDTWLDDFYVRTWQLTEPYITGSLGEEASPFEWVVVAGVTLIFPVGWHPVAQFGYDAFFIFLGLIMIPASTMYLVRGGRSEFSSKKLFYFLILFMMGFGLLVGGIMP